LTTGNGRPLAPCNVAFGNPERALLSADLFLFSSYFDAWVGSAPFPLFKRVILAPVCGRAYSRSATLYFPTQKINGRITGVHFSSSLSVFMPNPGGPTYICRYLIILFQLVGVVVGWMPAVILSRRNFVWMWFISHLLLWKRRGKVPKKVKNFSKNRGSVCAMPRLVSFLG
jgi:hypothetical protein